MKRKNKKATMFKIKHRGYDRRAVDGFIAAEQARADEVQIKQRERITALSEECELLKGELSILRGREEQIKSAFITATQNADKMTADVKARYAAELERLNLFRAKWTGAYEQLKERYHFDKDALNMESVAVSTQLELQKFLMQDFSLNKGGGEDEMEDYFRSEVERLTTMQFDSQANALNSKYYDTGVDQGSQVKNITSAPKASDAKIARAQKYADKADDADKERQSIADLKEKIKEAENRKKAQSSVAFSLEDALNPTESLADICKSLGLNSL